MWQVHEVSKDLGRAELCHTRILLKILVSEQMKWHNMIQDEKIEII